MDIKKILLFSALSLVVGFYGCSKEQKAEAPKQEQITKNLVPAKAEMKGQNFNVELNDLKVAMTVDTASKEIVETPSLKGNIKITNISKDITDIQAVTLEYLDEAGKPIARTPEEKTVIGSPRTQWGWNAWGVGPGMGLEASFDIPIPMSVIKEKSLRKMAVNLVYVSPHMSAVPGQLCWYSSDDSMLLHEEILTLSVMLSDDFNI